MSISLDPGHACVISMQWDRNPTMLFLSISHENTLYFCVFSMWFSLFKPLQEPQSCKKAQNGHRGDTKWTVGILCLGQHLQLRYLLTVNIMSYTYVWILLHSPQLIPVPRHHITPSLWIFPFKASNIVEQSKHNAVTSRNSWTT